MAKRRRLRTCGSSTSLLLPWLPLGRFFALAVTAIGCWATPLKMLQRPMLLDADPLMTQSCRQQLGNTAPAQSRGSTAEACKMMTEGFNPKTRQCASSARNTPLPNAWQATGMQHIQPEGEHTDSWSDGGASIAPKCGAPKNMTAYVGNVCS